MGMSTHVIGFVPPDDKWSRMKSAWDACKAAGIVPPDEVEAFFNYAPPDDRGVEIDLERSGCASEWSTDSSNGYEIDLSRVPDNVRTIRFYNSY